MTYRAKSDNEVSDRPALEIEITPEMIEAGVAELCKFNTDYASYNDGVYLIVAAALRAGGFIKED